MSDFYSALLEYKHDNKLNNSDLGGIINKSGDAFRMAISRKSLTKLEIEKLEKLFKNEQIESSNNDNTNKKELSVKDAMKVIEAIYLYEDQLLKYELFSTWVDKIREDEKNKVLKAAIKSRMENS